MRQDDAGGRGREQDAASGEAPPPEAGRGAATLSACVINHNGERYLERTLAALFREGTPFQEVLLVDNESGDGSVALVRERFPRVRIVELGENRGPAAARNAGYRRAAGNRILFLDNDVELLPGSVSRLVEALAEHPAAAVATPRIVYADRPDVIQYDGGACHFIGLMALLDSDCPVAAVSAETREIDSMISACFLVDRTRLGSRPGLAEPFDDDFFIYLEDHDFGLRTRIAGLAMLKVPGAVCLHGAGTVGLSLRDTGRYVPRRVLCLIRNRWLVLLKDYSARTLIALSPALVVYEVVQLAGVLRKGWLPEWRAAARFVVRERREILRRRRAVQRSRVVPDRRLLVGGPVPFTDRLATGGLERAGRRALDAILAAWWPIGRRLL